MARLRGRRRGGREERPRSATSLSRRARVVALRGVFTDASARGLALFFGLFSLANSLGWFRNGTRHEDIWWIDLSLLPRWLAGGFGLTAAVLLVAWGFAPQVSRARRMATAGACLLLSVAAIANATAFYGAWNAGRIAPAVPFPASLLYAAAFVWLARRISAHSSPKKRAKGLSVAIAVGVFMVAFPLVQMVFFGTTDYRRPADAAVVLGARVFDNGVLSTALEDRVRTGADLYKAGLVKRLVMSGGIGTNGVDETVAMRRRAIELGVPSRAIVLDNLGVNTDASVAQTTSAFRGLGIRRVLTVSQSWHLPRVKLAYLKAGWDVSTVPATTSTAITQTPYLMLREIPAFWKYWAGSV